MKTNRTKTSVVLLLAIALGFQGLMISVSGCGGSKNAGNTITAGGNKSGASGAKGTTGATGGSGGTAIVPTGTGGSGDTGTTGDTGSTGASGTTQPPAPSYYEYAFVKVDPANNNTTIANLFWGDTKGSAPKPLSNFIANGGMALPFWNTLAMTPDASKLFYSASVQINGQNGFSVASLDIKNSLTAPIGKPTAWGSVQNSLITFFAVPLADNAHVLASADDSTGGCTLRKFTIDGNASTVVRDAGKTNNTPNEYYFGVAASPVTNPADPLYNLILFSMGHSQSANSEIDVWINKIDGTLDDAFNLTPNPISNPGPNDLITHTEPSFSPYGGKVAYSVSKKDPNNVNNTIYRIDVCDLSVPSPSDLTTAKLQNCQETQSDAVSPSWSCDGRKIFYIVPTGNPMVQNPAPKGQLYWMNVDLTGAQALTNGINAWAPAGSPKCPM